MAKDNTVKVTMTFSKEALEALKKLADKRKESPAAVLGEGITLITWFDSVKENLFINDGGRLRAVNKP